MPQYEVLLLSGGVEGAHARSGSRREVKFTRREMTESRFFMSKEQRGAGGEEFFPMLGEIWRAAGVCSYLDIISRLGQVENEHTLDYTVRLAAAVLQFLCHSKTKLMELNYFRCSVGVSDKKSMQSCKIAFSPRLWSQIWVNMSLELQSWWWAMRNIIWNLWILQYSNHWEYVIEDLLLLFSTDICTFLD